MSTPKSKDLGPLSQSALTLEADFKEMDRLSAALTKFVAENEPHLEHAQKLLGKFGEVGFRVAEQIQILAKSLDESRQRAEAACQEVSKSAAFIQQRSQERNTISDRFQGLAKRVQEVSGLIAQVVQSPAENEEKQKLLPQFQEHLGNLASEATILKDEARTAGFKELEREAETLADRLRLSGKKIRKLVEGKA